MRLPFGPCFERAGIPEADLAQALGLELLLRQRHAAVEYLRVAPDAVPFQVEAADAVEDDARALRLGPPGVEGEAIAGVADGAGADRIEELPAEVAAALGEMRQQDRKSGL